LTTKMSQKSARVRDFVVMILDNGIKKFRLDWNQGRYEQRFSV
jgi:hypothetical protein